MAAGHPVRIVQLFTSIIKSVDYAMQVNCIEDLQYKLKTVIPVLNRSMAVTLEGSYALIVTIINETSGRLPTLVRLERTLNEILVYF